MPEPITLTIGAIKLGTAIAGKIAALAKARSSFQKWCSDSPIAHSATTASGVVGSSDCGCDYCTHWQGLLVRVSVKLERQLNMAKPASAAFNARENCI